MSTTIATTVLPATGVVVPETGWSVSSASTTETSRGVAFVAKLRYEGKLVGTFENAGVGGMDELDVPPELRESFGAASEAFVPPVGDPWAVPQTFAEALMGEYEAAARYNRLSKKQVMFIQDPAKSREVRRLPVAKGWLRPDFLAALAAHTPTAVVWSGGAFVPALEAV